MWRRNIPEITYGEHIVDNTCMQLVMNPYQYDMLVMENLYGDIISDLCAAFCRRAGIGAGRELRRQLRHLRSGSRLGARYCRQRHGQSNGGVRSALLMLRHLGEAAAAEKIQRAGTGLSHRRQAHAGSWAAKPDFGIRRFRDRGNGSAVSRLFLLIPASERLREQDKICRKDVPPRSPLASPPLTVSRHDRICT